MNAISNARNPGRRKRQIERASVDGAHKAILVGEKSLGEISDMVKTLPMGNRFNNDRGLDVDLPDIIFAPRPVLFRHQRIFGMRLISALWLSFAVGLAAGVPFGFALQGSAIHLAVAGLLWGQG